MKKRALLAGAVLVLAGAGACSNAGGQGESATEVPVPDFLPRCDEVFVAGNVIDRRTFGDACRSADNELVVPRPGIVDCADGRELVWNDLAWGYVGDAMQLVDADADEKLPVDEALNCLEAQAPGSSAGQG